MPEYLSPGVYFRSAFGSQADTENSTSTAGSRHCPECLNDPDFNEEQKNCGRSGGRNWPPSI
jgi:hypothetical protein